MLSRIGIIAERAEPARGGLAVASSRIARLLANRLDEVHLIHLSKEAAPGARGRQSRDGVMVHPVGVQPRRDDTLMSLAAHVRDIGRSQGLELLHGVYASSAGFVAHVVAKELGLPSVVSMRGNDLDRGLFRGSDLPFLREALTGATVVTGVSRALSESAASIFGVPVTHVTNSVDVDGFHPEGRDNSLRASLGLGEGAVLGFVGELRDKKGMRFLLPAVEEVARRRPVWLLIVGGVRHDAREAFDAFMGMAPELAERIRIVDYERSPRRSSRLMALCDLMVFPSLYDGTSNAVLEAMAAGRPILATDVGGNRDLIRHGETGALLPLGDLDCLPEAIEEVLDLPQAKRDRMGHAARDFVCRNHTPEAEREAYLSVYEAALRAKASA